MAIKEPIMLKRPLLISLALGLATFLVVGAVDTYLPYSETKIWVIDALTVTGVLIALIVGLAYPQGVHGAPLLGLGLLAMAANLAVYIAFWYLCLWLLRYFRQKDLVKNPIFDRIEYKKRKKEEKKKKKGTDLFSTK